MKRIKWVLMYAGIAGVFFWAPSIALHASRGYNFRGLDMLILTLLLPVIAVCCFVVLWRLCRQENSRAFIVRSMLLGIWALGPLFLTVSASFAGGGFAKAEGWKFVIIGTLLFPIFTFEGSTYDGTMFALMVTTFLLIFISENAHAKFLKRLRPT